MADFDKFYTKKEVAKKCYNKLNSLFNLNDSIYLEPSAGNGAFLDYLPKYEAYDLVPENDRIIKQDFLNLIPARSDYITIGNPPFGKRSKLAVEFFNKASLFSDIIAFILPISFMKFSVQKQLNKDFKLINTEKLPEFSFLDKGNDFDVNCIFQIYVKTNSKFDIYKDLRLKKSPSICCEDFEIWQYNATKQSLNVINEDWDIAVYRQSYHDYNHIFYQSDKEYLFKCMNGVLTGKKQQFFFVKFLTEESKNIILKMDFNKLAARNISTPGFGKADFVSFYINSTRKIPP